MNVQSFLTQTTAKAENKITQNFMSSLKLQVFKLFESLWSDHFKFIRKISKILIGEL